MTVYAIVESTTDFVYCQHVTLKMSNKSLHKCIKLRIFFSNYAVFFVTYTL